MSPCARSKDLVVLVHGFGSSEACWSRLLTLLRGDEALCERFEFVCFSYETQLINPNPLRRIPRLTEIAETLKAFLEQESYARREVTLVGHSQGGLVIHGYLAHMLCEGLGEQLRRVRQVVTFATPHAGSTTLSWLRRLLYWFFDNPHERALRVLDPETADVVDTVRRRVVEATAGGATQWPIPVHCFFGRSDNVVPDASARGPFGSAAPLRGDHFTILRPDSREDERYQRFAEVLRDPVGHPHLFEVDCYETTIAVHPVAAGTPFAVQHGEKTTTVHADNRCEMVRSVRFSRKNRCELPYEIRYKTSGWLTFLTQPARNEAPSPRNTAYAEEGKEATFHFRPRAADADQPYVLKMDIYKGFDQGNRDVHFHLGRHSRYRRLTYTLDLRPYLGAGYVVTQQPRLYLHADDPGDCKKCKARRELATPVPAAEAGTPGLWRWELDNVRQGVTDILWDVAPGQPAAGHAPASPRRQQGATRPCPTPA